MQKFYIQTAIERRVRLVRLWRPMQKLPTRRRRTLARDVLADLKRGPSFAALEPGLHVRKIRDR